MTLTHKQTQRALSWVCNIETHVCTQINSLCKEDKQRFTKLNSLGFRTYKWEGNDECVGFDFTQGGIHLMAKPWHEKHNVVERVWGALERSALGHRGAHASTEFVRWMTWNAVCSTIQAVTLKNMCACGEELELQSWRQWKIKNLKSRPSLAQAVFT